MKKTKDPIVLLLNMTENTYEQMKESEAKERLKNTDTTIYSFLVAYIDKIVDVKINGLTIDDKSVFAKN